MILLHSKDFFHPDSFRYYLVLMTFNISKFLYFEVLILDRIYVINRKLLNWISNGTETFTKVWSYNCFEVKQSSFYSNINISTTFVISYTLYCCRWEFVSEFAFRKVFQAQIRTNSASKTGFKSVGMFDELINKKGEKQNEKKKMWNEKTKGLVEFGSRHYLWVSQSCHKCRFSFMSTFNHVTSVALHGPI